MLRITNRSSWYRYHASEGTHRECRSGRIADVIGGGVLGPLDLTERTVPGNTRCGEDPPVPRRTDHLAVTGDRIYLCIQVAGVVTQRFRMPVNAGDDRWCRALDLAEPAYSGEHGRRSSECGAG